MVNISLFLTCVDVEEVCGPANIFIKRVMGFCLPVYCCKTRSNLSQIGKCAVGVLEIFFDL